MPNNNYRLTLYITGGSTRAEQATANLLRLCDLHLTDRYELDVIDVLEEPDRAEAANIMATPTLIRECPPPIRRVIGDLSDDEALLVALDMGSPCDHGELR